MRLRLRWLALALICPILAAPGLLADTGTPVPGMEAWDQFMTSLMARWNMPGAQLAVTQHGRLVLARGYGLASRERNEPVQPASLFRIASITKPITAAAILKLVEQGRLHLDDKVFTILNTFTPPAGQTPDARLANITFEQVLQHSGGWDSGASFDPMFRAVTAATAVGVPPPALCPDIIRYMLGRALDFNPGARYAYSNFGYCVLGRVIEKITGMTYEAYVREQVLRPMGITDMRLGRTLPENRAPGEVTYYGYPGQPTTTSVFPPFGSAPWHYGGFHLEAMDSHGGWLATAVDLVRFAASIDGRYARPFLNGGSIAGMTAKPSFASATATSWYGFGWLVRRGATKRDWLHDGSLDGTWSLLVRNDNGLVWAVVFNSRPRFEDWNTFAGELDNGLYTLMRETTAYPSHDLFPDFGINDTFPVVVSTLHGGTFLAGITPGSWVTITGHRLSRTTRSWEARDFAGSGLPTSLDGVRVLFNGQPGAISYISPSQINAQAPAGQTAGPITIEAEIDGVKSPVAAADLRDRAPGFFGYPSGTRRHVAAVHTDGAYAGDPSVVPGTRSASGGGRLLLYGTGFARSPAGVAINAPVPLDEAVEIRIGGRAAVVEFAGLVSPGLFQFNIVVPEGLAAGYHEVIARIQGVDSPAGYFVYVGS
jgi:N-acyl-D-amino-acid deacylase